MCWTRVTKGEKSELRGMTGHCTKGDSVVSGTEVSLLQRRRHGLMENGIGTKGESPSGRRGQKAYPPVCQNCIGMQSRRPCLFRHTKSDGQPSEESMKSVGNGQVASLKATFQLGCVSQDSPPRKSIQREVGKGGIELHRQILQGHMAPHQNPRKKGSIARSCAKVRYPRTRSVCTLQETLQQERCARREVLLACRSMGNAGTLFEKARGTII